MQKLIVYIPMDRRYAIARGELLPEHSTGAALFADISGFTPLTEALVRELGPQRGAEELTNYLNLVYDAVIEEVHRYGGSVIAFAGDAITCWFDEQNHAGVDPDSDTSSDPNVTANARATTTTRATAAIRATHSALAIQQVMQQFAAVQTPAGTAVSLSIKVAVAKGPVRRFVVGDPTIRVLDALAGETLVRLAAAEHLAEKGDVVLDGAALDDFRENAPPETLEVVDIRHDPELALDFSVVSPANISPADISPADISSGVVHPPAQAPVLDFRQMDPQTVRTWLIPSVYERINLGLEEFLAELRPTTALFLRFSGIDYDGDDAAGEKLDAYIRWIQRIVDQYEGTLIDLNIGDKGSYIYINFGAPLAHENNGARAALAALALRQPSPEFSYMDPVQIGMSQGRMRAGVYGGTSHRTYGVLGDEVNMAARLMMKAQPGDVMVSEAAWRPIAADFVFEALPPMRVKGKRDPVNVYVLKSQQSREIAKTLGYVSPMVGRQQELARINQCLSHAKDGKGQIIAITGEAGVGKSRLLDAVVQNAQSQGGAILSGGCESYGTNSSYMVWQPIWRALFGLDSTQSNAAQLARVDAQIRELDPAWAERIPLLAPILQLSIPENEFTQSLDAKLRKTSLHSLLVDLLRAMILRPQSLPSIRPLLAQPILTQPILTQPILTQLFLIVLEDCQWLDALSVELLQAISQSLTDCPLCILILSRELTEAHRAELDASPNAEVIPLFPLELDEAILLIEQKVSQLSGAEFQVSRTLAAQIEKQAQGNPFYVEELTTYLYFQGYFEEGYVEEKLEDEKKSAGGEENQEQGGERESAPLEMPDSLHRLVLSRLDQLTEGQKIAARVASVIGRVFPAAWLHGAYPQLGELDAIEADLEALRQQNLTTRQASEPELTYFFRQVLTQAATYESLPHAMRSIIHSQIGLFIEDHFADSLEPYLDLLVYHYDNGNNVEKRKEYLLKGAESARAKYANATAIDYYRHVLPLLSATESITVQRKLGQVLELTGQWDEARLMYEQGLAASQSLDDLQSQAWYEVALGQLTHKQGNFDDAWIWLGTAKSRFQEEDVHSGTAQVLHYTGTMSAQQGNYDVALTLYQESLAIREQIGERKQVAYLLGNMGIIARRQNDPVQAKTLYEQGLAIRRELGDRWGIANSLNNLGNLTADQGDLVTAHQFLEEALTIHLQLGDRWQIGNALNNLANVVRDQADYATARLHYRESLNIYSRLGDKWALAYLLEDIGKLMAQEGKSESTLILVGAAAVLREETNAPLTPGEKADLDTILKLLQDSLPQNIQTQATAQGRAMDLTATIEFAHKRLID